MNQSTSSRRLQLYAEMRYEHNDVHEQRNASCSSMNDNIQQREYYSYPPSQRLNNETRVRPLLKGECLQGNNYQGVEREMIAGDYKAIADYPAFSNQIGSETITQPQHQTVYMNLRGLREVERQTIPISLQPMHYSASSNNRFGSDTITQPQYHEATMHVSGLRRELERQSRPEEFQAIDYLVPSNRIENDTITQPQHHAATMHVSDLRRELERQSRPEKFQAIDYVVPSNRIESDTITQPEHHAAATMHVGGLRRELERQSRPERFQAIEYLVPSNRIESDTITQPEHHAAATMHVGGLRRELERQSRPERFQAIEYLVPSNGIKSAITTMPHDQGNFHTKRAIPISNADDSMPRKCYDTTSSTIEDGRELQSGDVSFLENGSRKLAINNPIVPQSIECLPSSRFGCDSPNDKMYSAQALNQTCPQTPLLKDRLRKKSEFHYDHSSENMVHGIRKQKNEESSNNSQPAKEEVKPKDCKESESASTSSSSDSSSESSSSSDSDSSLDRNSKASKRRKRDTKMEEEFECLVMGKQHSKALKTKEGKSKQSKGGKEQGGSDTSTFDRPQRLKSKAPLKKDVLLKNKSLQMELDSLKAQLQSQDEMEIIQISSDEENAEHIVKGAKEVEERNECCVCFLELDEPGVVIGKTNLCKCRNTCYSCLDKELSTRFKCPSCQKTAFIPRIADESSEED